MPSKERQATDIRPLSGLAVGNTKIAVTGPRCLLSRVAGDDPSAKPARLPNF
jgi:hypothetical protein